jgi:hypothetical protein
LEKSPGTRTAASILTGIDTEGGRDYERHHFLRGGNKGGVGKYHVNMQIMMITLSMLDSQSIHEWTESPFRTTFFSS